MADATGILDAEDEAVLKGVRDALFEGLSDELHRAFTKRHLIPVGTRSSISNSSEQ